MFGRHFETIQYRKYGLLADSFSRDKIIFIVINFYQVGTQHVMREDMNIVFYTPMYSCSKLIMHAQSRIMSLLVCFVVLCGSATTWFA